MNKFGHFPVFLVFFFFSLTCLLLAGNQVWYEFSCFSGVANVVMNNFIDLNVGQMPYLARAFFWNSYGNVQIWPGHLTLWEFDTSSAIFLVLSTWWWTAISIWMLAGCHIWHELFYGILMVMYKFDQATLHSEFSWCFCGVVYMVMNNFIHLYVGQMPYLARAFLQPFSGILMVMYKFDQATSHSNLAAILLPFDFLSEIGTVSDCSLWRVRD